MAGTKELKEAVAGVMKLVPVAITIFKDGAQLSDAAEFWEYLQNNPDFKQVMTDAYTGIPAMLEEAKDLDLKEGIELLLYAASFAPEIIDAFRD